MPVSLFGFGGECPADVLVDTGAIETVDPMTFWEAVKPAARREGEAGELSGADGWRSR